MKLKVLYFILLIAMVVGAVYAQQPAAPVLMLVNGEDIWGYYPTGLTQLTFTGYAGRPYLSPDAGRMAYTVIADVGVQALQRTGGLVSELPSDIELVDLATRTATRIAGQPPDATFNAGEPARAVVRSAPAWSPDGAAVAWTEDRMPEGSRRLAVYHLASGETRTLVDDLPLQAGFQQTLPVRWGEGGIALHSATASTTEPNNPQATANTFFIYNAEGSLLSSTAVAPQAGEFIYDFQWIDDRGADKLGVMYSSGRWDMIDPATGGVGPLEGSPELYSLTAPQGLAIVFGVTRMPDVGPVFTWRAGDTPLPYTGPIEWLSIAPDGGAAAFAQRGEAFIWRDGVVEPVPGTNPYNRSIGDIVWGPVGWRVATR